MPNKEELDLLHAAKLAGIVGGFDGVFYWSSTESGINSAWSQAFNSGFQSDDFKNNPTSSVRAVRAF